LPEKRGRDGWKKGRAVGAGRRPRFPPCLIPAATPTLPAAGRVDVEVSFTPAATPARAGSPVSPTVLPPLARGGPEEGPPKNKGFRSSFLGPPEDPPGRKGRRRPPRRALPRFPFHFVSRGKRAFPRTVPSSRTGLKRRFRTPPKAPPGPNRPPQVHVHGGPPCVVAPKRARGGTCRRGPPLHSVSLPGERGTVKWENGGTGQNRAGSGGKKRNFADAVYAPGRGPRMVATWTGRGGPSGRGTHARAP